MRTRGDASTNGRTSFGVSVRDSGDSEGDGPARGRRHLTSSSPPVRTPLCSLKRTLVACVGTLLTAVALVAVLSGGGTRLAAPAAPPGGKNVAARITFAGGLGGVGRHAVSRARRGSSSLPFASTPASPPGHGDSNAPADLGTMAPRSSQTVSTSRRAASAVAGAYEEQGALERQWFSLPAPKPAWQAPTFADPAAVAASRAEAVRREAPTLPEAQLAAQNGVSDLKVYLYDLPPRFNQDIIDRIPNREQSAFWYRFTRSEEYMHKLIANSTVRTFHPEEADLFWVPAYGAVYLSMGGVDVEVRDRARQNVLDAVAHIRMHYPHWDRFGGRDHVFMFPHDQGACYAIRRERCLTESPLTPQMLELTKHAIYVGANGDLHNPAFRRGHDIVIPPVVANPDITKVAMAASAPTGHRGQLASFRGQVSLENRHDPFWAPKMLYGRTSEQTKEGVDPVVVPRKCGGSAAKPRYCAATLEEELARDRIYSNGVRQRMYQKYKAPSTSRDGSDEQGPPPFPDIVFSSKSADSYVDDMLATDVCISPLGHATWTVRTFEAIMLGCIPLIIADDTVYPFQDWLDWSKFSIIVSEEQSLQVEVVLAALQLEQIEAMQAELKRVARSFVFNVPNSEPGDVFSWLLVELAIKGKSTRAMHRDRVMPPDAEPA